MASHYEPSPTATYRLREAQKPRSAWRDYSTDAQSIWTREVSDDVVASVVSMRHSYRWEITDSEGNVLRSGYKRTSDQAKAQADKAAEAWS